MPFNNENNNSNLNFSNSNLFPANHNSGIITHVSNASNLQPGLGFSNNLSNSILTPGHPLGEGLINSATALSAENPPVFSMLLSQQAQNAFSVAVRQGEMWGQVLSNILNPAATTGEITVTNLQESSLSNEENESENGVQYSEGNAGQLPPSSANLNMVMMSAAGIAIGASGVYLFGADIWRLIKPIIASTVSRLNNSLSE